MPIANLLASGHLFHGHFKNGLFGQRPRSQARDIAAEYCNWPDESEQRKRVKSLPDSGEDHAEEDVVARRGPPPSSALILASIRQWRNGGGREGVTCQELPLESPWSFLDRFRVRPGCNLSRDLLWSGVVSSPHSFCEEILQIRSVIE
jgi:hypothetical protein